MIGARWRGWLSDHRDHLAAWLARQRWVRGADHVRQIEIEDLADATTDHDGDVAFVIASVATGLGWDRYFLPMALEARSSPAAAAIFEVGAGLSVCDGLQSVKACRYVVAALDDGTRLPTEMGGCLMFQRPAEAHGSLREGRTFETVTPIAAEQSHSTARCGAHLALKAYRRLQRGVQPEIELSRYLTQHTPGTTPELLGWADWRPPLPRRVASAVFGLQRFAPNRGDGWSYTLQRIGVGESALLADVEALGATVGRLHVALAATSADAAFRPEPITLADVTRWIDEWRRTWRQARVEVARLARNPGRDQSILSLIRAIDQIFDPLAALAALAAESRCKTRIHGDLHLGQSLKIETGWLLLDFEGEPDQPLARRRAKASPLRDVAGMLRSFAYAAAVAQRQYGISAEVARAWERQARQRFLDGYRPVVAAAEAPIVPSRAATAGAVIRAFAIGKAIYECRYEARYRPDWVDIPLASLAELVAEPLAIDWARW